jgi:predicted glutamine amidotransferase
MWGMLEIIPWETRVIRIIPFPGIKWKRICFIHNGTAYKYKDLETGHFQPRGDTDSEYIFCHIMNYLIGKNHDKWMLNDFKWLLDLFADISRTFRKKWC